MAREARWGWLFEVVEEREMEEEEGISMYECKECTPAVMRVCNSVFSCQLV